jgi:predicted alpha/beta-fold hydrolase
MMGCESASHYYRVASAGLWLHRIATPTCFVLPLDDPIVNGNRVRQDDFAANKFLLAVITNSGGHSMDLPYGSNDSSWFAKAAVEFAEAVCKKLHITLNSQSNSMCILYRRHPQNTLGSW